MGHVKTFEPKLTKRIWIYRGGHGFGSSLCGTLQLLARLAVVLTEAIEVLDRWGSNNGRFDCGDREKGAVDDSEDLHGG